MTTAEARRLCKLLVIPFFVGTGLFLVLRDMMPRRHTDGVPSSSVAGGGLTVARPAQGPLGSGAYTLQIPSDYWEDRAFPEPDGASSLIERETIRLTNDVRASAGLTALEPDSVASAVARSHARDVVEGRAAPAALARSPELLLRVRRVRPEIVADAGSSEFLYEDPGQTPPEYIAQEAVDSWVNSMTHRGKLLCGPCEEVGVGAWATDEAVCVIEVVTRPLIVFDPPLPVSAVGTDSLHVEGEFVGAVTPANVRVALAVPPGPLDFPRKLGYKPMKEVEVPIEWEGSARFRVDLPCGTRGVYVLRISDGSRSFPEHVFRVE